MSLLVTYLKALYPVEGHPSPRRKFGVLEKEIFGLCECNAKKNGSDLEHTLVPRSWNLRRSNGVAAAGVGCLDQSWVIPEDVFCKEDMVQTDSCDSRDSVRHFDDRLQTPFPYSEFCLARHHGRTPLELCSISQFFVVVDGGGGVYCLFICLFCLQST